MRQHYEKIISVCCFLFLFVNIGFPSTSFSVYQPYIVEMLGNTGGSLVLGLRTLVTLFSMFFVNIYYQRLDCRLCIFLATLMTALGFFVYSFASTLPVFLIGAVFAGLGYGLGGTVGMTLLTGRWYKYHVGTAIGFATVGSGFASIVIPPTATAIIHGVNLGLAFRLQALLAAVIGIVVFVLIRNYPEQMGLEAHGAKRAEEERAKKEADLKKAQAEGAPMKPSGRAIGPRRYWLLYAAMLFVGANAVGGLAYLSILMTSNGFSPAFAATMVSICGITLTVSKFASGVLFDKVGTKRGSLIVFAAAVIGLIFCCLVPLHITVLVVLGAALLGAGASVGSVGISVWSLELSTLQNRATIVKNFQIAYAAGGFIASTYPGFLSDLLGTYEVSYVVLVITTAAAAAIVYSTYAKCRS